MLCACTQVDANGNTHVYYSSAQHPSFKCTHSGTTCSCTLKHPTHDTGGCKEFESLKAGNLLYHGGDCTASGLSPTPPPTPAPSTWNPKSSNDLRRDIGHMVSGQTINIGPGTFGWGGNRKIGWADITVKGSGKGVTIIDGGNSGSIFELELSSKLTLSDITLQHARGAFGAIKVWGANTLVATNVEFKSNYATDHGGALAQHGKATFVNCDFIDNFAVYRGGAIMNHGFGDSTFTDCTFSGNKVGKPNASTEPDCHDRSCGYTGTWANCVSSNNYVYGNTKPTCQDWAGNFKV